MTAKRDDALTDNPEPQWRLEILAGPNAGAEMALSPGPYRLGMAAANDIVLSDPAIQAEHLSLTISPQGAALTAHAPGVDLHRRALAQGALHRLRAGSEIRLGSTVMRLHGPTARGAPGRAVLACAAAAGLATACLTFAAGTPGAPQSIAAQAEAPRAAGAAGAAGALRQHLVQAGLGQSLTVSATGNGALCVAGILPATSSHAWQGVRGWFDAIYGSRVTLLERFTAPTTNGEPPLQVAAVALAPVPLVITRDGARYTEGAMLPGGWEITAITGAAVTLAHNGQVLRITL